MKHLTPIYISLCWLLSAGTGMHAQHPNLILTQAEVNNIRQANPLPALFNEVLEATREEVDAEIEAGVFVPKPKDMAGGYTHERHKKNFFILQKAGNLYQITGDEKYAAYIREVFLSYADQFPGWDLHPTMKSYATGKIFWQCLNDANWLVYCSQAYDAIYDYLSKEDRARLEQDLFRPLADFISIENPKFFNRIHNHSTWGNAAVGMIGLVMKDEELIQRALYGIKDDGLDDTMLDNDGGFIKVEGQKQAGFLAQLDFSFSPDGYFTEGPYYLRYAMTPFLLFSKALSNSRPELKIYDYRDGILKKAVFALLNQTDARGQFFPVNDAQKGMSWNAREVVAAVDIGYADFGQNPSLLSVAQKQNEVLLDGSGFVVARDLERGLAKAFAHQPVYYRDGAEGEKGGLAILRAGKQAGGELCAVMKFSAHGMGHGHFDKLSYSLYDEKGEVVQDYGAARWVNVDQKGGGRYLPENNSFAKQSIAHNTVVVDETSHYKGSVKKGEAHHPDLYFLDLKNENLQIVSAKDLHAYPGTQMHRTLVLLKDEHFSNPILIDVFRITSDQRHQYDLPLWFQGHLLSSNFELSAQTKRLTPLGNDHGYQHIWEEASAQNTNKHHQITWFNNYNFLTMTAAASPGDELIFARSGANDPNYNLRHDPVFIQRRGGQKETVFVSLIESHGTYSPVSEIPLSPFSEIQELEVIQHSADYTVVRFSKQDDQHWTLAIANQQSAGDARHELKINGKSWSWTGPYYLKGPKK